MNFPTQLSILGKNIWRFFEILTGFKLTLYQVYYSHFIISTVIETLYLFTNPVAMSLG